MSGPRGWDVLFCLAREQHRIPLLVEHAASRKDGSLAATPERALVALEPIPAELSEAVAALAAAFPGAPSDPLPRLEEIARANAASLTFEHAWPADFRFAEPWRDGAWASPVLPGFGEVPDVELLGLELGTRRLVKREGLSAEGRARVASAWRERGFLTAEAGALFVAQSELELRSALDAERVMLRGGEARFGAVVELGSALGYPDCCVSAFSRLRRSEDWVATAARLPGSPLRAEPLALWANPDLRLVSHLGCSLDCPATADLSKTLLAELERRRPGTRDQWLRLARRVHVVSIAGRHAALEVEPLGDDRLRILRTAEVSRDAAGRPALVDREEPERIEVLGRPAPWAILLADHRGSGDA
jgi:hypothetical protein